MIDCVNENWPECIECGEEFNPKRKELGYNVCLGCGELMRRKRLHTRRSAQHLFSTKVDINTSETKRQQGGRVGKWRLWLKLS